MSGVAIVRALLAADPRVLALVPASRVLAGVVPQGTTLPAVSVTKISGSEEPTIRRRTATRMVRERVQVTVLGKTYGEMARLLKAAGLGPGVYSGQVVSGYGVVSVLPWGDGPDLPPGEDGIYETSRDFMVTFVEAN